MLWLLACTGNNGSAPTADPFYGQTTFTVEKPAPLESESVELHFLGLSSIYEDGFAVLAAADDQDAFDLVMVLPEWSGPGSYVPVLVRYRKGQQHLVDTDAECEVEVTEEGGSFECEGLHEDNSDEPWALRNGSFADGERTELEFRGERFAAQGYNLSLDLLLEEGQVSHEDSEAAVVIPWRGVETWVLMDDGVDGHPDDLQLRIKSEAGRLEVYKRPRKQAADGVAVDLGIAGDTELEVSVENGETQTGTSLHFELWSDLHEAPDDAVLFIK